MTQQTQTTTQRAPVPDAERCETIRPGQQDVPAVGIIGAKYARCPKRAIWIAKHRRTPRQYRCCNSCARELARKDFNLTAIPDGRGAE